MPIRVLCLHGHGTNSKVMEAQTAALRRELDDDYEWVFPNGTVSVPMAPELEGFYSPSDDYYGYFSLDQPWSLEKAVKDLEKFIIVEGPFDIVMAVSVASSLIGNLYQKLEAETQSLFKGAVFFSGMAPLDSESCEKGQLGWVEHTAAHKTISIPTANIWGLSHKEHSAKLAAYCSNQRSVNLENQSRTPIPGAAHEGDLVATAQAIRQTVEEAVAVC